MEKFNLENQVEKVLRGSSSLFLNPIDKNYVVNKLNKMSIDYNVFKLFVDAEKYIIYKDKLDITLFEIVTNKELTHREILGFLYHHNINELFFGDIIISDKYYIVVSNSVKNYLLSNILTIGKNRIKLIEKPLSEVEDYKLKYKTLTIMLSSPRIDNLIAKLSGTSRSLAQEKITNKEVVLNYQITKNKNYSVKVDDIISIRRTGKFKIENIEVNKNNKYKFTVDKYI